MNIDYDQGYYGYHRFQLFLFIIVGYIEVYKHTMFEVTWITFRGGDHVFYGQKLTKIDKNSNSRRPPDPAGLILLWQIGGVSSILNHNREPGPARSRKNQDFSKLGHFDQKSEKLFSSTESLNSHVTSWSWRTNDP